MIDEEFGKKKMEILLDLKRLIRDNAPESEKEILKAIAKYGEVHKKKFQDREKKMKEISTVLTPVQRAKYLIFQEEFNREIRKTIEEIKKHRRFKP
jgi:hypothetical protein